jgi:hypothetical protein
MESFAEAFGNFGDPGVDQARACVAVGWAMADLVSLLPQVIGKDPTGGRGLPNAECPLGLTTVQDLSPVTQWEVRIVQIRVALGVLTFPQDWPAPNVASLELDGVKDQQAAEKALCAFHEAFLVSCAAVEANTAPTSSRAAKAADSAATPVGLTKCYEVGRLLAGITITGATNDKLTADDITHLLTLRSLQESDGDVSAADRAHALLGDIRASLPSAAAYSVARHLEDWSAWANGADFDSAANLSTLGSQPSRIRAALAEQGQVWHTILSGQTLPRDYLVPTSYADAGDHLLLHWTDRAQSLVRSFLRTIVGKAVLVILLVALAVFLSAFIIALQDPHTSGAKSGLSLAAVLTSFGAAAGTLHVSRQRISSTVGEIWSLVEPVLVDAELKEAIAQATRRLPADTIGGGSARATYNKPASTRTARAHRAAVPDEAGASRHESVMDTSSLTKRMRLLHVVTPLAH